MDEGMWQGCVARTLDKDMVQRRGKRAWDNRMGKGMWQRHGTIWDKGMRQEHGTKHWPRAWWYVVSVWGKAMGQGNGTSEWD